MADKRPYFHASTAELEEIYKSHKKDIPTLKRLIRELEHRKRPKARVLQEKITNFLASQNIDLASAEEGQQQLPLYPSTNRNSPKKCGPKQGTLPDSVQCPLEGIFPESGRNSEKSSEASKKNTGEQPGAESRRTENEEAGIRVESGASAPDESLPRKHRINLEKIGEHPPKTVPVTKENFWRSLFRLLTGKKQKS